MEIAAWCGAAISLFSWEMAAAGEKGSLVTILCDFGDRYPSTLFDDGWLATQGLSCGVSWAKHRRVPDRHAPRFTQTIYLP
jgi:hypothetical protein